MDIDLKKALEEAIAARDPEIYNRALRKWWKRVLERALEVQP